MTHILGLGLITYAEILGMICFMFSSNMLGEIAKRISIYDLDANLTDRIFSVSERENLIRVKEAESDMASRENHLENRVQKIESEIKIEAQKRKIRTTSIDFNSRVNDARLDSFDKKFTLLSEIHSILCNEYKLKADQEVPLSIDAFKQDAKNMTHEQLSEAIDRIMNDVNRNLDSIPHGFNNLKKEMDKIAKELKQATSDLAVESE